MLRDQFAAAVRSAPPPRIVVDLQETGIFGTVLVNLLLEASDQVRARNTKLVLVGPRAPARDLLRVTRLDQLWPVLDTTEAAIATLASFEA